MFDYGLLTRWPLTRVFVAVLSSRTKHLVRFTLGHFHHVKVRSGAQCHARYADQIRLEADANFTHVKEWLSHIVENWDDSWVSLTCKLSFFVSGGDDTAGFVNKLDIDGLVNRTVFSFAIRADIKNHCRRYDRAIECDLYPVIAVCVGVFTGTPRVSIILIKRGQANLCKKNVTNNVRIHGSKGLLGKFLPI